MATFLQGLRDGLRRSYCSQVRNTPQWFSNLREVVLTGDLIRRGDAINKWVCGPDQPPAELPPPPFPGGQCNEVYLVDITVTSTAFAGGSAVFRRRTRGPIGGVRIDVGPLAGVAQIFSSGEPLSTPVCGTRPQLAPAWRNIGVGGADLLPENGGAIAITGIIPCGADNCGDVPLPPPGPITVDTTIDYDNFEGDSFSLTVPVIFAPIYVALDGTLRIPISIGDLNLNGEININNDFSPSIELGNKTEPGDTEGGDPGLGEPGLDGEEPPSGPDSTIIGVFVRSRIDGRNLTTLIPDEPGPDILAPGVGTVRFGVRAGQLGGWTQDIRVKGVNEFVYCPVPWGATNVSVRSEPGWTNEFTVLRGKPITNFDP